MKMFPEKSKETLGTLGEGTLAVVPQELPHIAQKTTII